MTEKPRQPPGVILTGIGIAICIAFTALALFVGIVWLFDQIIAWT